MISKSDSYLPAALMFCFVEHGLGMVQTYMMILRFFADFVYS